MASYYRKQSNPLFVTEGFHGIEAAGAPGGDVTGGAGDGCKSNGGNGKRCGIVRGEAEELALHELGECQGSGDAGSDSDGHENKHFTHDHPNDASLRGAKSHANADFAGALGNGVGHDAVEPDDGKKRGEKTEDGRETGDHALCGK